MDGLQTSPTDTALQLQLILERINDISSLPHVALRVMEVANAESTTSAELKRVVESDPALVARIMRYVNGPASGLRAPVSNLHAAIAFLGFKQIRNLAMTALVSEVFRRDEPLGTYRRRNLWRHMLAVGLCARMIAARRDDVDPEDAFLAGAMHDLGLVLEDQYDHHRFAELMLIVTPQRPLVAWERDVLGYDHAQLGEAVAQQWNFPEAVCKAIRFHHTSVNYRGEHVLMVRIVEVANTICTLKGISSVGQQLLRPSQSAVDALRLTRADYKDLTKNMETELAKYEAAPQGVSPAGGQ